MFHFLLCYEKNDSCEWDDKWSLALGLRQEETGEVKESTRSSIQHLQDWQESQTLYALLFLREVGNLDFHMKYSDFSMMETSFKLITLCQ